MIETKFKMTELGMIPEDWKVKAVKEVANLKAGVTTDSGSICDVNIGYPCYGGNGFSLNNS